MAAFAFSTVQRPAMSRVQHSASCVAVPLMSVQTPKEVAHAITRRSVLAAALVLLAVSPLSSVSAESMLEVRVRSAVGNLIECQQHALELRDKVAIGVVGNVLSEDEALYIARAAPVWLAPAVSSLKVIIATGVDVGEGVLIASRTLPVHLGELSDERRRGSRDGCVRELNEYIVTITDTLRLEGLARFVKGKRWNGAAWADLDI
jgi:hypothetical protein